MDCFSAPVERLTVSLTPGRTEPQPVPLAVRRHRCDPTTGELTERLGLARHGARTFWALLTCTGATILARTLLRLRLG